MGDIEDLLARQPPAQRKLGERLRAIIKSALPDASETTNSLGNPVYSVGSRNIVWIAFARDRIDLGFFDGVSLKSDRLTGKGHKLRHIKVTSIADLNEKELTKLLKDAQSLP